jgi:hypothetical protein
MRYSIRLTTVILFAIAMAYCESAVVVYLRSWLLPNSGQWSLDAFPRSVMLTEMWREAATLVMLIATALVAGRDRWDRVGYFLIGFGVWDIFYYVWLKALINWPESFLTPDILFLIPKPWLGYVIEPCAVSALMIISGIAVTRRRDKGLPFVPPWLSWLFVVVGSVAFYAIFTAYQTVGDTPSSSFGAWREIIAWLALACYLTALYLALRNSNAVTNRHP